MNVNWNSQHGDGPSRGRPTTGLTAPITQTVLRVAPMVLLLGQYGSEGPFLSLIARPEVAALLLLTAVGVFLEAAWVPPPSGDRCTGGEMAEGPRRLRFILAAKHYVLAALLYRTWLLLNYAHLHLALAPRRPWLAILGLTLIAAGSVLRLAAIRTLGPSFQGWNVRPGTGLVERGPYRLLRHPSYAGLLLQLAGLPLVLQQTWGLLLLILPAALVVRRLVIEEELLSEALPADYDRYRARTWRLLPGVF